MRHQTITRAGVVILSLVATSVAFAAPEAETSNTAVDECLSSPKMGETPPGGHWYYRTDRVKKRKCWYLGEVSSKTRKHADAAPAHSEALAEPTAKETKPSTKEARAEMNGAAAPADDRLSNSVWPTPSLDSPAESRQTDTHNGATPPSATPPNPQSQPQVADASVFAPPTALAPQDTSTATPYGTTAATISTPTPQSAEGTTEAPAATVAPAASESASDGSSVPMLLAALTCALGFAAILAGIVMKIFARTREVKISEGSDRTARRDIWSEVVPDAMPQPYRSMSTPVDLDAVSGTPVSRHEAEVEQLLGRSSRRKVA